MRRMVATLAFAALFLPPATAQEKKVPEKKAIDKKLPTPSIPPTAANYKYGTQERQVFDFWQAKSETPTPLVLLIREGARGGAAVLR